VFLSNKLVTLERKGEKLLLVNFGGENYHDQRYINSKMCNV